MRTPYYVGGIATVATVFAIIYASCGSRNGDPDRTVDAVGEVDGGPSVENAPGAFPDAAAVAPGSKASTGVASSGNREPSEQDGTNPIGTTQIANGALPDGGPPGGIVPTPSALSTVRLRPGLSAGVSVGGLEFTFPSRARGPCGCQLDQVCVRSSSGIGAIVDLCLPRPKDCPKLSCGCFPPSPCGSKAHACSNADAKVGILTCSIPGGEP